MRQDSLFYCAVMICVIFVLALCGCISVPNSPTSRFYMLRPIDAKQVTQAFNIASGVIIAIGPVKIPEYQNRPQIVTQSRDKMLTFAQFDRWGEPLEAGLARIILEDLTVMLPGANIKMFPYNFAIPVKYQVIIDVVQLESELNKDLFFAAQWTVIDAQENKMLLIKKSGFRQPIKPHNYSGLAEALSITSAALSSEIAEAMSSLVILPPIKKN